MNYPQSLELKYAEKLSEGSAKGRRYNGEIIDSEDYAEEIYEANQFHGQDGLGRAIFGYADNNQARLEARNANGEVRGNKYCCRSKIMKLTRQYVGQYQYIDAWGNDIQVQYWVDSLGFHQTDNIPIYNVEPVTETPEVKKAREEHERLWRIAANRNGVDLTTNNLYNSHAEKLDSSEDSSSYDDNDQGELEGQVSNQHQSLSRYPVLPYSEHISPNNAKAFGKVVDDSVIVEANSNNKRPRIARQQQNEFEEVTSEPRGFFYSFNYPAPVVFERTPRTRQSRKVQLDSIGSFNNAHSVTNEAKKTYDTTKERSLSRNKIESPPTASSRVVRANSQKKPSHERGSIKFKRPVQLIHS